MAIADLLTSIAEKIQRVYALKDNKPYINSLEITDYRYFNQEGKRTAILEKLDTSNGTNFYYFCNSATDLVEVDLDFSKATQMYGAFRGCTALTTVENLNLSKVTGDSNFSNVFYNCSALKKVSVIANTIKRNISFSYSPLLTLESAKSILLGLYNYAGNYYEFSFTITFHADTWTLLDNDGTTAPDGLTWREYVNSIGWNA